MQAAISSRLLRMFSLSFGVRQKFRLFSGSAGAFDADFWIETPFFDGLFKVCRFNFVAFFIKDERFLADTVGLLPDIA